MDITVDTRDLIKGLNDFEQRQVPYALARAMNTSANDAQNRLRLEIHAKFTVRRESVGFMERLVKRRRDDMATKTNLNARIRIEGPEGQESRGDILARHVEGGIKTAGESPFFIPADHLRPSPYSAPPRSLYPKNLRVMTRRDASGILGANTHVTKSGKIQVKGKQRTFVIAKGGRVLGVYQRNDGKAGRTRPGTEDTHLIWSYTDKLTLPRRFRFYKVATEEFMRTIKANFAAAFADAMKSAR